MTDNEIIKALLLCKNNSLKPPCAKCPLVGELNCLESLHKSTLDLINRQRAEIERYKTGIAEVLQEVREVKDSLGKAFAEERSEAIKEFAERLKKRLERNIRYMGVNMC